MVFIYGFPTVFSRGVLSNTQPSFCVGSGAEAATLSDVMARAEVASSRGLGLYLEDHPTDIVAMVVITIVITHP